MLSDEEAQEIARLLSPTNANGIVTEDKPDEREDNIKDKEDHDNAPDWLSDVLSVQDSSVVNSTTQDYR